MAWETRKHGTYYYRKRRVDGQVVSEYVGRDELAHEIARADAEERQHHLCRLAGERVARHRQAQQDAELRRAADLLRQTAAALLRLAGFHQHKGTWRRKRDA